MPESVRTHAVDDELLRRTNGSPSSSPATYRWVASGADVRRPELLLGKSDRLIETPLWVGGDEKRCSKSKREINRLGIVLAGLQHRHARRRTAEAILGELKCVNVEAQESIEHVTGAECDAARSCFRSFVIHTARTAGLRGLLV